CVARFGRRKPRSPPASWRRRWPWKRSRNCSGCDGSHHPCHRLRAVSGRAVQPDRAAGTTAGALAAAIFATVKIVPHIFPTGYAAVDRDLPRLLAKHKPDALLMFGLAPRARALRIETRARNTVSLLPDATATSLSRHTIAAGGSAAIALPAPVHRLLAAFRTTGVPAALSRDAGRYLCNYLCWRAAEAAGKKGGPRLAAFVHVPKIARTARRPGKRRK